MKTILATALLLGTIADNKDKSNQVQAVKIQAKSEEVLEQAAQAMAGIGQSAALASGVDEGLALQAEALVEADALADLEVEARLRQDEKDDSAAANQPSQSVSETADANKPDQPTTPANKEVEHIKKEETGEEMVEIESEQKKKSKKKHKFHNKHGKKKHSKSDKKDRKDEKVQDKE